MTFVARLRQEGIIAPFVVDRAMAGAIFLEYIRQCLAPTLAPGDIVVVDNLPAHKIGESDQRADAHCLCGCSGDGVSFLSSAKRSRREIEVGVE